MAVIPFKSFSGMVPRVPAHLLELNQAQSAFDCDFTHGELRPLKGTFFIKRLSNAARGLFTLDGILFYSWPQDVNAFRSPVVSDSFQRLYFSGVNGDSLVGALPGGVRVTTTGGMSFSGGPPAAGTDFNVGVPQAGINFDGTAYAPTVLTQDATDLPGVTTPKIDVAFWFESDGKQFQFTDPFPYTEITRLRRYRIVLPTATTGTVATATDLSAVYMRDATTVSTGTAGQDGGTPQPTYDEHPINGDVRVVNASTVITSGGTELDNVVYYHDKDGVLRYLNDIVDASTNSGNAGTPSTSAPQAQVSVTNGDTGELVFRATTSNSSTDMSNVKGGVSISLQKVDGQPNTYDIVFTYGKSETRAYVYTLVNQWGEEGVPSPAALCNVTAMQTVRVETISIPDARYKPINRLRLYRSNTSSAGSTAYQFVMEMFITPDPDGGPYVFNDTATGDELGEVLASDIWDAPPVLLTNLTQLPNGVFAASWGNSIYFSVPYRPWAWPADWAITVPYGVTSMIPLGNSLLVTTTAFPYLVNGAYPDSFVSSRIPMSQAGIWQRGTVDLGPSAAYISHDGIVMMRGSQGSIDESERFFTREDWRNSYGPSISSFTNLRLLGFEGKIMGLRPQGSDGFLIDIDEGGGAMTKLRTYVNGTFISPETDQCYITDTAGNLYQLFGGTAASFVWQSKDFIVDRPTNFGALQVVIAPGSGSVTFTVYADDVARTTMTISQSGIYRLASGFRARRWSIKLEGNATVREMYLANVPTELENV